MPQVWDEEARSGGGGKANGGGMVTPAPATALLGSLAGWLSRVADPPAPRVCGQPGGPPVTAPRVTLRDGRHLAYCESGVPREQAKFKVVFSHGFTGSREDSVRASQVRYQTSIHDHRRLAASMVAVVVAGLIASNARRNIATLATD